MAKTSEKFNCIESRLQDLLKIKEDLSKACKKTVGGLDIEIYKSGFDNAPVIVALHGLGFFSELSAKLYVNMMMQGFTVVAVDKPIEDSVDVFLSKLSSVVDFCEDNYSKDLLIFGYSIGSPIALKYAEQDCRIKAFAGFTLLVPNISPSLVHTMGWQWINTTAMLFPSYTLALGKLFQNESLKEVEGSEIAQAMLEHPRVVTEFPMKTLASYYSIKHETEKTRLDFPSLIIQGHKDQVLDNKYAKRVVAEMAHVFDLIEVPEADHFYGWKRPEKLAFLVCNWFKDELSGHYDCVQKIERYGLAN